MAEVQNPNVGANVANPTAGATTTKPSVMATIANKGNDFADAIVKTIGVGVAATSHAVKIVGEAEEQATKIAMKAVNSTGKIGVAAIETGTKLTTNSLNVVSSVSNSTKRIAQAGLSTGASVAESAGSATASIANSAFNTSAKLVKSTGNASTRIVNSALNTSAKLVKSTGNASARIANSALNTSAKLVKSTGNASARIANSTLNASAALVESASSATKQGVGEVILQAGKVTQSVGRLAGVTTAAVSDMLTRFANAASKSTRNAISTNAANNKLRNMNPQHFRNALIRDYKLILGNTITEFGKLFTEYNKSFENYIKVYQSTFCIPGWFWGHRCTPEILQKIKTFKDSIKQIGGKFKFNITKISTSVGFYDAKINRLTGLDESDMMKNAQEITKANFDEFERLLREITEAFDALFSTIEKATTKPINSNTTAAGGYKRRTRARRNRRTRKIRSYN